MNKLQDFNKLDIKTLNWIKENARSHEISTAQIKKGFNPLNVDEFKQFFPEDKWFVRKDGLNEIHGKSHIYRVILNTYLLCQFFNYSNYTPFLIAAAMHDIARTSDYKEKDHGFRAAIWFKKEFDSKKYNLSEEDISAITQAIKYHDVKYEEIPRGIISKYDKFIDILKCADAMDRYRLSKPNWWPNKKYLKININEEILELAKSLVCESESLTLEQNLSPEEAIILSGLRLKILRK